ncbi:pentapeptide repeat-containing protein [Arthrobacter sp. 260]|uniref:pentapeptide repeat-containing protein n=1 Tax=Arthrobacter sp. 260 TaxID=2735314 RepID=UPI0014921074|nr:pentapeptide repeat-containing protein [Arthrobacter sp. 260]NOJ61025.1 pentapeptide repeat-containing protein [Arthrobacter sp. 260]
MAGVYAMAGVADQVHGLKQQQCIDVLCGYLRLPYSPDIGANHQHQLIVRRPSGDLRPEVEEHHSYRQNDRVVRQTIVNVVKAHLRDTAEISWSKCNFDFHGVLFEQANFGGVEFAGRFTSFAGAYFAETTRFGSARFIGVTTFADANFTDNTDFSGASFSGVTLFNGTHFAGFTDFSAARFTGSTLFFASEFTKFASFDSAYFAGKTGFNFAQFSLSAVDFGNPERWDPPPKFDWDDDPTTKPANVEPAEWPPVVNDGK